MTSDSTPPEGSAGTPENSENAAQSAMADAKAAFEKAGFATPEGMVALGALILLATWVLFNILVSRGGIGDHITLLISAVAPLVFFGKATWTSKLAPRPVLLKTMGYILAILGLFHLISFFRYWPSGWNFQGVVRTIMVYAGYAVAFMGARSIKV